MVTAPTTDEPESNRYRYNIRIMFKHPSMDLAHLTKALGVVPQRSVMAGTERRAPNGQLIAGLHRESVWSDWFDVAGSRRFFSDFDRVINRLEPHKALLAEIVEAGGSIDLIVALPGDINIGDTLPWRQMARLAAPRVDLRIEVFPEFN
jgi:hypothetical protein